MSDEWMDAFQLLILAVLLCTLCGHIVRVIVEIINYAKWYYS